MAKAAQHGASGDPTLTELVMRIARRVRRGSLSELEPLGLTPSQSRALRVISHDRDTRLRLGDLAARLDIAARSTTEVVDALESRGMVRRSPDPDDRRAVTIALTDEGRATHTQIERGRLRRDREFFGHLTEAQQQDLAALLEAALVPHQRHSPKTSP